MSSGSTLPAGSSTSFVLALQYPANNPPPSVAWAVQNLPTGIQANLVGQTSPWQRRLLMTGDGVLAAGTYAVDVVATTDTGESAQATVQVRVTACVQTASGSSTQAINSNLVELITAGKPAVEHGLLVPLQICESVQHVQVKLTQALAEDGSIMPTPPRFYLFRSEVWPAPNHVTAHGLPELYNVQVPNIPQTNSAQQLDADVEPGLYLLIFERDRYAMTLEPPNTPASVSYDVLIQ